MKYKKSLIFICLLICFISMASVVASDVNETVVANDDQNEEIVSVENEELMSADAADEVGATEEDELNTTPGTFTDLANDIANAGDELNLTRDYIYSSGDSSYNQGINIDKKITVNGNGFVINGNNQARALKINHNHIILDNIVFMNFNSTDCAIDWEGDNGILNNSHFINCTVETTEGVICWSAPNGLINNSTFINCKSSVGAVNWRGINGIIKNSRFQNCFSYSGTGGGIYWNGFNGQIYNSEFSNNTECSVYFSNSKGMLINSIFINCGGNVVVWEGDNGTLTHSQFINCSSNVATNWKGSNGNLTNSIFVNCISKNYGFAGAVYWEGVNGSVSNCNFKNCTSEPIDYSYGGAIFWEGINGNLTNSTFINCSSYYGGGVYWAGTNGSLSNSTFINTSSESSGGAVYWKEKINGTLFNCNFENCFSNYGGAIIWDSEGCSIYNSFFNNCSSRDDGGAIICQGSNCSIYNCFFMNCNHARNGGAINWNGVNGFLLNCSFINCSANYSGGAIYWERVNGSLDNCTFVNCLSQATTFSSGGGAIYWKSANGNISKSNFTNCVSNGVGGAIKIESDNSTISQCTFLNNVAETGNAIYYGGQNKVKLIDSKVNKNDLTYLNNFIIINTGLGTFTDLANDIENVDEEFNLTKDYIYSSDDSSYKSGISINKKITINGNGHSIDGNNMARAFIISLFNDNVVLKNITFVNCFNSNSDGGGAVYWHGNNGILTDCNFINCSSSFGGAIVWSGDNGILTNCNFVNFSATFGDSGSGGAVSWHGNGGVIYDSSFINCSVISGGGAISWFGVYGNISDCSFVNCSANYGGAIDWSNFADKCVLNGCSFVNCSAMHDGGAVNSEMNNFVLNGCSFVNCSANSGGAVCWLGVNGSLSNCSFVNCLGKYYSIYWGGSSGILSDCSFVNCSTISKDSSISAAVGWYGNDGAVYDCSFVNLDTKYDIYWYGNNGKVVISGPLRINSGNNYRILHKSFVNLTHVENINFGEVYSPNYTIISGATGIISVYVDNIFNKNISINQKIELNDLNAGNHTIKVIYQGDDYYISCENLTTLKVNKINTTINVLPISLIARDTILNVTLNNKTTGTISVLINNKNYTQTLYNGKSSINILDLPKGNYNYTIFYLGDQNFNENRLTGNITIKTNKVYLNVSTKDIFLDEIAKIKYNITKGASGILSVYNNDRFIKNISVGNVILLENLTLGNHTVKVIYNGDDYYGPYLNTTTFEVRKLTPTFSFTKNNAIAGDDFVITYILNEDATGEIICNNLTNQLVNGIANFTINNIKGGLHQFNISYSGDSKYNPVNKTVNVDIKFRDAVVDFDVEDIMWRDSLTIAPTITSGATGYLNIYIDNNLNGTININGRKDFTFYVGGYHYIKVAYGGDDYYSSNSTTKGFNVIKLDSTCSIKGNIEVDNYATVYVTLNEDATGMVDVYIKGNKYSSDLISGVATFRVPNLAAGNYSVTIDYAGDSKYNSVYASKSLEVTLKPSTITLNVRNILTGESLTINPIVTSSASGSLKIYVDNALKKTISIGSSYTIEQPTIGSHNVRVVYDGDSYHQGNETKTTFRVFTFYPIEVQNAAIIYGSDKHFQAIFYDEYGNLAANKLVAFRVNGEDTVVTTNANGLAVFDKDLPIGTYTITVINAYVNEEHDYNLKVFTSIESRDMIRAYNTGMDFKVKLLDENADTLSRGYALFNVNSKDYPVVADNNGIAILNANLPVGTYTVTTTNGRTGETKTNKITIVPSVEVNNMIRGYNSGMDFTAKFLDADATPLTNQKVAFKIGPIEYEATTDENGYAILNQQLDVGKYKITVINKVTGERATRNLTIVERIVENNDVIRIYGEESYYTIRLIGDDGNFVGENEIVNININNIDYQIRTNANGYASFRIDENIGSYEIFAEYKGYEVYNDVYVLERVYYISNLNASNVNYKQYETLKLDLSTFDSAADVVFEIVGDNGYRNIFSKSAQNSVTLLVSDLGAGKYTVTAKYYDLDTFKFSSMVKTFTVNKIDPKIIVVVENANVGETAKITVNIPDVEGNVEIKVGNALTFNEYLVKNGVIVKEINSLPAGTYDVDVTYMGDNNYTKFTESTTLMIIQPKSLTTIVASDVTTTQGVGTYLVATLKDIDGKVLEGKGISIYLNGVNSILTTDKNGQVKLAINKNLAANTYIATITYVGDDYYVGSNTVAKVTVNKAPTPTAKTTLTLKKVTVKRSAKKLVIQATLKINGKAVKGKTIKFKFNKKTYKVKTNKKGVAKVTIKKKVLKKLKKGKKVTYTATYGKITKKVTVKVKK